MKQDKNSDFINNGCGFIFGREINEKGVGLMLDKDKRKCILGYWQLLDKVRLVKLEGKAFNMTVIVANAFTSENKLYKMRKKCKI